MFPTPTQQDLDDRYAGASGAVHHDLIVSFSSVRVSAFMRPASVDRGSVLIVVKNRNRKLRLSVSSIVKRGARYLQIHAAERDSAPSPPR